MKRLPALSPVLLCVLALSRIAFCGEVTLEARLLLQELRKKVAGIRTLSFTIKGDRKNSVITGFYRRGGTLKLSWHHFDESGHYQILAAPGRLDACDPLEGTLREDSGTALYYLSEDLWFHIPFLETRALARLGDISAYKQTVGTKSYRILVFEFSGLSHFRPVSKFEYEEPDLKLRRKYNASEAIFGMTEFSKFQTVGQLPVPLRARGISHKSTTTITHLRIDPPLQEEALRVGDPGALTLVSLSDEELQRTPSGRLSPQQTAALHLSRGYEYLNRKADASMAFREFWEAMDTYPGARAPYYWAAKACERDRRYRDAEEHLCRARDRFPGNSAYTYHRLLRLFSDAGLNDKALAYAREWTNACPKSFRAWASLAKCLRRSGSLGEAIEAYEKSASCPGIPWRTEARCQLELAECCLQHERSHEGESILTQLARRETLPVHYSPLYEAGKVLVRHYCRLGKLEQAIQSARREAEQGPDDPHAWRFLVALFSDGYLPERVAALERLAEVDRDELPAVASALCWLYKELDDPARAADFYAKALRREPNLRFPRLYTILSLYRQAGRVAAARELANSVLEDMPGEPKQLAWLGRFYADIGESEKATRLYEKAADLAPNNAVGQAIVLELAERYLSSDSPGRAFPALLELSQNANQTTVGDEARSLLKQLLERSGCCEKYLAELTARAEATPDAEKASADLAFVAQVAGRPSDAARVLGKLVEKYPKKVYFERWIECLSAAGRRDELYEAYSLYGQKFPDERGEALYQLMWAYQRGGRLQEAIETGEEYVKEHSSGCAWSRFAELLLKCGSPESAVSAYREGIERTVHRMTRQRREIAIAEIRVSQGKDEAASKILKGLVAGETTPHLYKKAMGLLIEALRKSGQEGTYRRELEGKLRGSPGKAMLLHQLADLCMASEEFEKAASYYETLISVAPERGHYHQWIESLRRSRQSEKVVQAYEALFQQFPEAIEHRCAELVAACKKAGRLEDALRAARLYAAKYPKSGKSYLAVVAILEKMHRYDDAIEALKMAISETKKKDVQWQWQLWIARLRREQGRAGEAESMAAQLLRTAPSHYHRRQAERFLREMATHEK